MAAATWEDVLDRPLDNVHETEPVASSADYESFERLFEATISAVSQRIDNEEDARIVAAESLARALESPLWTYCERCDLPVGPVINRAMSEVLSEWAAGWRIPLA
ncbi:MAG: hypothetical protein HKP27_13845 [Myxococcales bacterium]|nr:hypothetical protein [Myxococcales bacterium]